MAGRFCDLAIRPQSRSRRCHANYAGEWCALDCVKFAGTLRLAAFADSATAFRHAPRAALGAYAPAGLAAGRCDGVRLARGRGAAVRGRFGETANWGI